MNSKTERASFDLEESLPEIPPYEIDRFGNKIDTTSEIWSLRDIGAVISLRWDVVAPGTIKTAFKLWTCFMIRAYAPTTVEGHWRTLRWTLEILDVSPRQLEDLDLDWWRRVRQRLRNEHHEDRLAIARKWFLWMADQEFPGIDEHVALEIFCWRIPGMKKGEAVARRDPDFGPLTDLQFASLVRAVRREQPITQMLVATMLCLDLGSNCRNLALLEEGDLHVESDPENPSVKFFQLEVPRIKKGLTARDTKRRRIDSSTGIALEYLIEENRVRFGEPNPRRPIFVRCRARKDLDGCAFFEQYAYQCTAKGFQQLVTDFGQSVGLCVPGNAIPFRINPRRLRYTFGCRLAAQGASAVMIAELLDHSDLQNVMVYVNASARLAERLAATISEEVGPIYEMFLGRIIEKISDDQGRPGTSQIMGRSYSGDLLGSIGRCGSGALCKLMPPLSCYVCDHFQPWRDADHNQILKTAVRFRDERGRQNSTPHAEALIERVITNIEAVIAAIEKIKDESRPSLGTGGQDVRKINLGRINK